MKWKQCLFSLILLSVLILASGIVAGCASPRVPEPPLPRPLPLPPAPDALYFHNVQLLGTRYDEVEEGTMVRVRFEVRDKSGNTLGTLKTSNFTPYENNVKATSESFANTKEETLKVPISLVLDVSKSMYDTPAKGGSGNAVTALKTAAQIFVSKLGNVDYTFRFYKFAKSVEEITTIAEIPDQYVSGRFTALYSSLDHVIRNGGAKIIVLFSDGADNASEMTLTSLENSIAQLGIMVHCIGFGDVENEYDKDGITAVKGLERISANGSFRLGSDTSQFNSLFQEIARSITSAYILNYCSPRTEGSHTLRLVVRDDHGREGQSPQIPFTCSKTPTGPGPVIREETSAPQQYREAASVPQQAPSPSFPTVANGNSITVGQVATGYVSGGQGPIYTLSVPFAQQVTIEMFRSDGSGLDPIVELLDASGNRIGVDDDGAGYPNARLVVFLNPGIYRISTRDFGNNDSGNFNLTVR